MSRNDATATAPDLSLPGERMLNRELSRLDFNARVLAQAADPEVPLLERVRFCSIVSSNLDEFFMVRVAGLLRQAGAGVTTRSADGRTPLAALSDIRRASPSIYDQQARLWREQLTPMLAEQGILVGSIDACTEDELTELTSRFDQEVFPVLTPLAVGPGQPFPYISGLSMSLGVFVREPESGEDRFARVKVPEVLPRFLPVGSRGLLLPLEEAIAHFLSWLFPGMEVVEHVVFRVTRDADFEVSDEADDLLEAVELELRRRRFGDVVRLEVASTAMPPPWCSGSRDGMGVSARPGLRRSTACSTWPTSPQIADLDRPELRYDPWMPVTRPRLAATDAAAPTCSRRCAAATCWCTCPTTRSRRQRRAVRAGRGQGPRRGRDQDHGVPHQRRLGDAAGADRGGRAGQADGVPGRAEGPLRRAPQHRVVARDGAGRACTSSTASRTSRSTPR